MPISAHAPSHAKPTAYDPNTYDMAIGINQGAINRLLQLSFERGYFRDHTLTSFDPKPGAGCKVRGRSNIRLTARPEIRLTSAAKNEGEMAVKFFRPSSGFTESLGLKGGLNVALKVKLKIEMDPKTGPRIRMTAVDPASVKYDPRDIRDLPLLGVPKKVAEAVADAVKVANEEFAGCPNESVIAEKLPLPDSVAGINYRIKDLLSDSNGNLIMYVEYGVKKNG